MGLINYSFYSKVLGMQTRIAVVLPTYTIGQRGMSLEEIYPKGKLFRTLYVLHGGSDDCTYYYRNTSIERLANEGGFAAVMPEVMLSFYSDMKHGARYFTYLSQELPAVVQSIFPLSRERDDHFVVGNSMGSHGAMKWALRCPEFFAAAAGMSGVGGLEDLGFLARFNEGKPNSVLNSFGTYEQYQNSENDLKYLAKQLMISGKTIPRLFSCCGTEDFTYTGCIKFIEYAKEIGLEITYEEGPGGHDWDFWERWLRRIVDWMRIGVSS